MAMRIKGGIQKFREFALVIIFMTLPQKWQFIREVRKIIYNINRESTVNLDLSRNKIGILSHSCWLKINLIDLPNSTKNEPDIWNRIFVIKLIHREKEVTFILLVESKLMCEKYLVCFCPITRSQTRVNSRIFTNSPYIWLSKLFWNWPFR